MRQITFAGLLMAAFGMISPLQGALIHQWTFNGFPSDSVGNAHGTLEGSAVIDGNRLYIDGLAGSRFLSAPFGESIVAKTLVAWVSLESLTQRPGSILTVENGPAGDVFDAIVLGERVSGQWMAGSNFFLRTVPDNLGLLETEVEPATILIAIAHGDDSSITIYRNGEEYASAANTTFGVVQPYCGTSVAQIGPRHGLHADVIQAWIDEARIYDTALTPEEVRSIHEAGPSQAPNEDKVPGPPDPVPVELLHQWTFNDGDAQDSVGAAHGFFGGNALVENGRLFLDGVAGSGMLTDQIEGQLSARTLVAWASLATLDQVGGSILTVEDTSAGNVFDAMVYGERVARQWMAGSNNFLRTVPDNGGPAEERLDPDEVMMAIAYHEDSRIVIYRDGEEYAGATSASQGLLVSYCPGYAVQIGPRHGAHPQVFNGWVNEARLYQGAMGPDEVRQVFLQGHTGSSKSSVVRSFSRGEYRTGDTVRISLAIDIREPERSIILGEGLPAGLIPRSISDGGVYAENRITWDLAGIDARTVTYEVAPGPCFGELSLGPSRFKVGDRTGQVTGSSSIPRDFDPGAPEQNGWSFAHIGKASGQLEPLGPHDVLLEGNGAGARLTEDNVDFFHVALQGDWEFAATIDCVDDPGLASFVGLMVRDTAEQHSAMLQLTLAPAAGAGAGSLRALVRRETLPGRLATALVLENTAVAALPVTLRIRRFQGKLLLERSADGALFTEIGSRGIGPANNEIALGDQVLVGLTVSAQESSARAIFRSVSGPAFEGGVVTRPRLHRGDVDDNGLLQLTDAVRILGFLFLGGAGPTCRDAADTDDNGLLQLTDAVRILGFLFLGQAAPSPPGPPSEPCGEDPVAEDPDLGCAVYSSC